VRVLVGLGQMAPDGSQVQINQLLGSVPPEYRERVYVFVAPYQTSFEGDNPQETEPTGKPKAISTHGLKPGWAGDHRFALFAGLAVPQGSAAEASATQVAPTLAKLLGLSVDGFAADPLF
jgi:hypothetical protein